MVCPICLGYLSVQVCSVDWTALESVPESEQVWSRSEVAYFLYLLSDLGAWRCLSLVCHRRAFFSSHDGLGGAPGLGRQAFVRGWVSLCRYRPEVRTFRQLPREGEETGRGTASEDLLRKSPELKRKKWLISFRHYSTFLGITDWSVIALELKWNPKVSHRY